MAGTQDFDKLLGTLKQINKEMSELASKVATARVEISKMDNPADRLAAGRQLGGYQTALTRKTQQANELSAQTISNISQTQKYASGQASGSDLERRMNLISLGVPLTTSEIMAKSKEIARQVLAQQNQITRELSKSPINRIATPDVDKPVRKQGVGEPAGQIQARISDKQLIDGVIRLGSANNKQVTAAQKLAEEEEKAIQSVREKVQAEHRYVTMLKIAEEHGFNVNDLKRAQSMGTAGVERFQFNKRDTNGVEQRLDLYNTPAGRTTAGISNQFRSFGQGVVRDIGELTKWSIALAAVYGPMKKVGELTQEMIDNQARLAVAVTSVASAFVDQNTVFDTSAQAADKAGEAVSGVIDAFTQAYRASGGGANQVERMATSQKLLSDSLLLSKLSTLDQAGAIDTLAAALRQSGGDLTSGTKLLDKWVRVTQIANVDLTTLSTGFAVLGDAAESAGISVDQLNGIIAAVAETGIGSGKEVANIARSLVSGFQSDQAQKALLDVGISAKDAEGNLRPFLEIMQQIHDLQKTGVIDSTQFSALTLALGGGTRRQAAYASFIKNLDRVNDVSKESATASGQAQAALDKQLETVQTSITKVANAFTSLAQTLGTEGGFLSILKGSADGTASLVKAFDGLVSILGKATPMLAAFLAITATLKYQGKGGLTQAISGFGNSLVTPEYISGSPLARILPIGGQANLSAGQKASNFLGSNVFGNNIPSGASQGLLASLIPAILNATNASDKYGKIKAGGDVAGGIAGGIVGTLTGVGPIIGATIGTAIAEAFVNSTIARKTDIFGYTGSAKLTEADKGISTGKTAEERLTNAEAGLYKSIGFGNESLGKFLTSFPQFTNSRNQAVDSNKVIKDLNDSIKNQDKEKFNALSKEFGRQFQTSLGLSPNELKSAFANRQQVEYNPQVSVYNRASEEARKAYDKALAEVNGSNLVDTNKPNYFTQQNEANKKAFDPLITSIIQKTTEGIAKERLSGDIKSTVYAQQTASAQNLGSTSIQYYTALGSEIGKVNGGLQDSTKLFEALALVLTKGPGEGIQELTTLVTDIGELQNVLNAPEFKGQNTLTFRNQEYDRKALEQRLAQAQGTGANLFQDVYKQTQLSQLKVPNVQGDVNKPLTSAELNSVKTQALQMQQDFYKGYLNFSDEQYSAITDNFDAWAQIIKDSGDAFFEKVDGIDPQFFQQAMQKLLEENKLKSQKIDAFGIQQVDLPGSKAGELQSMVNYYSKYLTDNFKQYQQKPEDIGIIFNDYVTSVLHGDNLAVKLALEKLVDQGQKQLDGQYNIPEGATFWVPLTAAYYRNQGGSGTGTGLDSTAVDGNTSATDSNTQALQTLTQSFQNLRETNPGYYNSEKNGAQPTVAQPLTGHGPQYTAQGQKFLEERKQQVYQDFRKKEMQDYPSSPSIVQSSRPESKFDGSVIQSLLEGIKNFFSGANLTPDRNVTGGFAPGTKGGYQGPAGGTSGQTPAPVSKLDLKLTSTTTLNLDGRILASALTNYLATSLLRTEGTQGTITKRYTI